MRHCIYVISYIALSGACCLVINSMILSLWFYLMRFFSYWFCAFKTNLSSKKWQLFHFVWFLFLNTNVNLFKIQSKPKGISLQTSVHKWTLLATYFCDVCYKPFICFSRSVPWYLLSMQCKYDCIVFIYDCVYAMWNVRSHLIADAHWADLGWRIVWTRSLLVAVGKIFVSSYSCELDFFVFGTWLKFIFC